MRKFLAKLKEKLFYDADRDFYAKVFPGTVDRRDLMTIRHMDSTDLKAVMEIESSNYQFPWSENIFIDCLRALNYTCWVCEEPGDKVIGYCIVSYAAGEAHIMNLCVHPSAQRLGAGRKMLEYMLKQLRRKAEKIFLEVRPTNYKAIRLYKSLGFEEIGIRKDYYPARNGREDALMLAIDMVPEI